MDQRIIDVARSCTEDSHACRTNFPEVLARLAGVGIERYHADLVRGENCYFLPDGDWTAVECASVTPLPAAAFDAAGVEAAARDIQQGRTDYVQFCAAISAAGCAGYHVSLLGRRAVYYGRTAEMHVEHFPS